MLERRQAVALVARPRRVALARVDDRAREVVREGRGLAAGGADVAQRHGRVRRSPSIAFEYSVAIALAPLSV